MDELVAEQAQRTPEAVAVECGDEQLTYAELDAAQPRSRATCAALGVGPDVLVGISVERSVEMLVGLLGILKAGGAYVPIDPAYPADRQAYMLEDAGASRRRHAGAPARPRARSAARASSASTATGPRSSARRSRPRHVARDPEQLAYVIYTSGSTGRPKGVEIPHRALVNFLCDDARAARPRRRTTCSSR